jgi:putative transcriptional regulator
MGKKLTGKALAKFEAERDVWQEVLDGVREIKGGGGTRTKVDAKSATHRAQDPRWSMQARSTPAPARP